MNSIILAAGQGKRLLPLTDSTPKGMVAIFGKSILEWQIQTMRSCGISDISIATGYCADKISFSGINYFHNKDFAKTNMVETLFCAKEKLQDQTIISYGDILYEKNVLQKLVNSTDDISIVVDKNWEKYWSIRFDDPLSDAESLILDNDGFIVDIGHKTKNLDEIQGQYIGLMKFQGEGIKQMIHFYEKFKSEAGSGKNPLNPNLPFEQSYMTDFIQGLANQGCKIKSVPIQNGWLEIDSVNDYEVYSKMYENKTLNEFFCTDKL